MADLNTQEDKRRTSSVRRVHHVLTLLGWAVMLSIAFLPKWDDLLDILKTIVPIFIALSFLVSLVLGFIPAVGKIRQFYNSFIARRRKRQMPLQFSDILLEAQKLFEANLSYSLRNYIGTLCNDLVRHGTIHSQLKCLVERLKLLSDWHWSLLTVVPINIHSKNSFERQIRDIIMFYRDTADVVREFCAIELPDETIVKSRSDYGRMCRDKYNQHIGRLEQLLGEAEKINPGISTGSFYRF